MKFLLTLAFLAVTALAGGNHGGGRGHNGGWDGGNDCGDHCGGDGGWNGGHNGGGGNGGHNGGGNGGNNGGGHGGNNGGGYNPCTTGLYPVALCCSTDAVGVLGIDCKQVTEKPTSKSSFDAQCAKYGRQAKCCLAPVLNQAVLCGEPAL